MPSRHVPDVAEVEPLNAGRMGIVIVNYGSHALIDANLPPLSEDHLVVVVDNWHSAHERGSVTELATRRGWHLIARSDNAGFGAAVNVGLRHARDESCGTFLVLNPDARVTDAVVRELHRHAANNPGELVSPVIEDSSGRQVFVGVELLLRSGRMRRAGTGSAGEQIQLWLTGACLAFDGSVLDTTGGFAEDYFLYWEDVDLSTRAVRAGHTLAVRRDLVVVHDEGGTQARRADDRTKSDVYYFYNCRNRLVFAARLLSRGQQLTWLLATPAASWEILMRGGRRQLLHRRQPLWAAVRGTAAGVIAVVRRWLRGDPDGHGRAYSST